MLMCIVGLSGMQEYVVLAGCPLHNAIGDLKTIGKEFQKNCYKSIFGKINTEEIFFQLTLITGCAVAQHCYNGDVSFLWEKWKL